MTIPDEYRIDFSGMSWAVYDDKCTFTAWNNKEIDSRTAAHRISKTNGVPVSVRQFELNAVWLGYRSGTTRTI